MLRPGVVWFGEIPLEMDLIFQALESCTHFVAIGTSGTVYPAAGFVAGAAAAGAHTVEINLEATGNSLFSECRTGSASTAVPDFVATLIGKKP